MRADGRVDVADEVRPVPEVGYGGGDDSPEFLRHNQEVDWGTFVSNAYWEHNYRHLRDDDRQIIEIVADFFDGHFRHRQAEPGSLRGIDVGSGANLYPALLMLPWSRTVTLTDVAASNREWLAAAIRAGAQGAETDWTWKPFWDIPAKYAAYEAVSAPRSVLAERHEIAALSVMELPPRSWDLGTMFFVAESMTSYEGEYEDACRHFMEALRPGAPFAAAFMDSSMGYVVADQSFPAVRTVDTDEVEKVLKRYSDDVDVQPIEVPALDPLRDGYKGMIIATGTTRTF